MTDRGFMMFPILICVIALFNLNSTLREPKRECWINPNGDMFCGRGPHPDGASPKFTKDVAEWLRSAFYEENK